MFSMTGVSLCLLKSNTSTPRRIISILNIENYFVKGSGGSIAITLPTPVGIEFVLLDENTSSFAISILCDKFTVG